MLQLQHSAADLESLNIHVLIVTFQKGPVVEAYVRDTGLSWPILLDEERTLYTAYGMERGSVWNVWGPVNWPTYIKLLLRGRKLRKPAGDVHQLGGDVLIDPHGIVRLHHVGSGPADRPPISEILDRVRQSDMAAQSPPQ